MTKTPARLYQVLATAEMLTWAGLVAAMISRYGFGNEVQWFFVAGLSHGIVFLAYALTALVIGINLRWGFGLTLVAVMVAIVPLPLFPSTGGCCAKTSSRANGQRWPPPSLHQRVSWTAWCASGWVIPDGSSR